MSSVPRESLWATLAARGHVQGELPARAEARAPWYVRLMLGIGGWIGAMFLFSFVGALFIFVMEHAFAAIAVGAMVCAGAAFVFRARPGGDFAAQFALAVSLAGQALIGYGLAKLTGMKLGATALVMAAVEGALFVLVPNFIHRVWAAWLAAFLVAVALVDYRLHHFAPALATAAFLWVALRELELGTPAARAAGYGLALAAMQVTVMYGGLLHVWIEAQRGSPLLGREAPWLGAAASALALIAAVVMLLRREGVALGSARGRIALAGALVLGAASIKAPGVGPAAAIVVVGFANGNRVLTGLGILAMLGYLSHYYYALHVTLLEKSAILAATGVALLLARLAVRRLWPKEAADA